LNRAFASLLMASVLAQPETVDPGDQRACLDGPDPEDLERRGRRIMDNSPTVEPGLDPLHLHFDEGYPDRPPLDLGPVPFIPRKCIATPRNERAQRARARNKKTEATRRRRAKNKAARKSRKRNRR